MPPASSASGPSASGSLRLPQPQPDPGEQLGEPERLGHVVVGAALERGHGVGDRVAGGQHDDRHPRALRRAAGRARSKPSRPGSPMSSTTRSKLAAQRVVEALAPVGDGGRAGGRRRAGPWRRTTRSAPRPRRSGCGPRSVLLVAVLAGSAHGQGDHEPGAGAARRPRRDACRRAPRAIALHDREPEAEALVAGAAPRCGRTARRSARGPAAGTPGPVSRTQSRTAPPSYDDADRDLVAGRRVCLTALSASWSTRLGEPLLVDRDDRPSSRRSRRAASRGRPGRVPSRAASAVSRSRSTGCGAEEVGPVALGEQDQVADQPRHPVDLVEQQRPGLGHLGRVVGVEQLEVAAQHGQRRLQLVAGVVEELALADERRLQPVEHAVEGAGQRGDVVVAGLGQPAGEVGLADLARRSRAACAAGAAAARTATRPAPVIMNSASSGDDRVGPHRRRAARPRSSSRKVTTTSAPGRPAPLRDRLHGDLQPRRRRCRLGRCRRRRPAARTASERRVARTQVVGRDEPAGRSSPPADEQLVVVGDVALQEELRASRRRSRTGSPVLGSMPFLGAWPSSASSWSTSRATAGLDPLDSIA